MPDPKRVEFITRHFKDLQTIRFAPVPAAMLLAPLLPEMPPHVSRGVALAVLLSLLSCGIGFYWWSTAAIKRRYGSVRKSREETQRMQGHPVLIAVYLIALAAFLWFKFIAPSRIHLSDITGAFYILIIMLPRVLDSTNPVMRRVVWASGLVLFGAGSFATARDAEIEAFCGAVWLFISIYDFLLLRRTFAEISGSPPGGATEVVARYG